MTNIVPFGDWDFLGQPLNFLETFLPIFQNSQNGFIFETTNPKFYRKILNRPDLLINDQTRKLSSWIVFKGESS
ncbi:hypothetical protein FQZ97_401760 [compost metagenome]